MTDGRILPFTRDKRDRDLERHAYLIQRIADLEQQAALLLSERDRLLTITNSLGKSGLSLVEGE
jgi:hypothetical protein